MTCSLDTSIVPHVRWVRISSNGDYQPDWEIECHARDRIRQFVGTIVEESPLDGIFKRANGALVKSNWHTDYVPPYLIDYILTPNVFMAPEVHVNGDSFEYAYPVVAEFPDKIDSNRRWTSMICRRIGIRGEILIKGEILSTDYPIRVKRTQTLTLPDFRTYVTEFIYEIKVY
jgi:hypothetical protein